MGNGLMSRVLSVEERVPFEHVLDYVLPIYHTKVPLKAHCKEKLVVTWRKVIGNKAVGYLQLKKERPDETPCSTSMEFFANRLMIRLYEVHPVSHSMFKKTTLKQGTLVMNMISLLVKEMDNEEVFHKHCMMLATSHAKFGVRATECKSYLCSYVLLYIVSNAVSLCYALVGIFGEVLFWTLRLVLGSEDYDFVCHTAWIKFYSRMLDVIVPVVLRYEMEHREDLKDFNVKRMMPIMDTSHLVKKGLQEETAGKKIV